MIKKIILIFLVCIALYHLLHTLIVYGWDILGQNTFSLTKDLFRIGIVSVSIVLYRSVFFKFLGDWKKEIILLVLLLLRAISISWLQGRQVDAMIIGFKYDIYPLFILISAIFLGMVLTQVGSMMNVKRLSNLYRTLIIGGLVRQVMKITFPELLTWGGYGPVGDYILGEAPPLYYRTGPGGMMRLQGIFAGPNNYGFFLVGVVSVLGYGLQKLTVSWKRLLLGGLFFLSLFRTLSRGAWIGVGVQVVAIILWKYPRLRKRVLIGSLIGAIGLVRMSIEKGASSLGHLEALKEGRQAFVLQPRGYGLGMAGPSIHRQGIYLPENHYLQLLLDIGIIGCVLWLRVLGLVGNRIFSLRGGPSTEERVVLLALGLGIGGLLIEGLFLHVWEDSMVNYLVLVPFGLLLGGYHYQQTYGKTALLK